MKKYPLVYIEAWDHKMSTGDCPGLIKMHVTGFLIYEDELEYRLAPWLFEDGPESINTEVSNILKSAVTHFKKSNVSVAFKKVS